MFVEDFGPDNMIGELVPTDSISVVPITTFIGTADDICPPKDTTDLLDAADNEVKHHYFEGADHGYYAWYNSQAYFDLILCELQIPDGPSTCVNTE